MFVPASGIDFLHRLHCLLYGCDRIWRVKEISLDLRQHCQLRASSEPSQKQQFVAWGCHTFRMPSLWEVSFAAANIESLFNALSLKPGVLLCMTKLEGAPSSPKVFSLPACCCVSNQPTILTHAKISQILHICKLCRYL